MATLDEVNLSPMITTPPKNLNNKNNNDLNMNENHHHHYKKEMDTYKTMLHSSVPREELARLTEEDVNELTNICVVLKSQQDEDSGHDNNDNNNNNDDDDDEKKIENEQNKNPLCQWMFQRNVNKMIRGEMEAARRQLDESLHNAEMEKRTNCRKLLQQTTSLLPFENSANDNSSMEATRKKLKNRVNYAVKFLQDADTVCPQWLRIVVPAITNIEKYGSDLNDPTAVLSTILPAALIPCQKEEEKKRDNDETFVFPSEWDKPFPSDISYLAFAEASFMLRRQRLALLDKVSSVILAPKHSSSVDFDITTMYGYGNKQSHVDNVDYFAPHQQQHSHQFMMDIVSAIDAARVLLECIVQLRLSHHTPLDYNMTAKEKKINIDVVDKEETEVNKNTSKILLPRIIRLAHHLNLLTSSSSSNQTIEYSALLYILLSNIGTSPHSLPSPPSSSPSLSEQRCASHTMARLCNMNSLDVISFLDKSRKHMVELLFVPEDEFSTIFNSPFLVMSPEILRVLVGLDLCAEDGFKLSDTAVSDMLEEEKGEEGLSGMVSNGKNDTNNSVPSGSSMKRENNVHVVGSSSSSTVLEGEKENEDCDVLLADDDLELKKLMESVQNDNDQVDTVTASSHQNEEFCSDDDYDEKVTTSVSISENENDDNEEGKYSRYQTDLEYLEDQFEMVETKMRIRKLEMQDEDDAMLRIGRSGDGGASRSPVALLRELHAKLKSIAGKINARMEATRASTSHDGGGTTWLPRMEALAELHGLDEFEKLVILTLVGATISKQVRRFLSGHDGSRSFLGGNTLDVGFLVELGGGGSLASQVEARRYFYNHSTLIIEGMVRVAEPSLRIRSSSASTTDIMDCAVELERRLLDHIVGLDTTLSEIQEGTELYEPQPDTDAVSLPHDQKELILRTVQHHELLQKQLAGYGFDNNSSTSGGGGKSFRAGGGCVLLFFGKSGTGKTMMAQAVAKHLGKMILSVNVGIIGNDIGGARDTLRFLFREAKIHNAVLFFDECESLFESRDIRSAFQSPVTQFLTEIEDYDGLVFLATNRAYELDEALFRRITLTVEFTSPDFSLRRRIWKTHLPPKVPLADDVDLDDLAMQFELTGGLIRQAAAGALSLAYSRNPDSAIVTQRDLEEGARHQLQQALMLSESAERALRGPSDRDRERSAIPKASLKDVVLADHSKEQILQLVHFEKARQLLFAHWGFDGVRHTHTLLGDASIAGGTVAVFYGPKGCGKALAAEAIAYELGRTIREISASEVLLRWISSVSGSAISASRWLCSFFSSAQECGSVVVVRGAEGLFSAEVHRAIESYKPFGLSDYANNSNTSFGILETFAQQIRRYTGVTILLSNDSVGGQDQDSPFDVNRSVSNLSESIRFAVKFEHPDINLRKELWEKLVPSKMPLLAPLDCTSLAEQFPLFTGASIRSVIVRTAELAALRQPKSEEKPSSTQECRGVTLKDFEKAAYVEQRILENRKGRYQSFSHEGIYN